MSRPVFAAHPAFPFWCLHLAFGPSGLTHHYVILLMPCVLRVPIPMTHRLWPPLVRSCLWTLTIRRLLFWLMAESLCDDWYIVLLICLLMLTDTYSYTITK
jgi:hypothetical protein